MTRVKICGITNLKDARFAAAAGADELGFNFYRNSPRFIEPALAGTIIEDLSEKILKVGVFVNEPIAGIIETVSAAGIDAIQLHGDEGPEFVSDLRSETNLKIIKAVRVKPGFDHLCLSSYAADAILIDVFDPLNYGGTGKVVDWDAAAAIAKSIGHLYLAGGLNHENVCEAIRKVRPYAVDAASGLEREKGKKDPDKVAAFIRNAGNA
jgi:phosphoribosylanthranilate isomerase